MDITDYKLIDCGQGRRLEKFGNIICDRPAPMAMWKKALSQECWRKSDIYFDLDTKTWKGEIPERWMLELNKIKFMLEPASNGQIGVFPEQSLNWKWIGDKIKTAKRPVRVLNGFAHTGGSTIAAANAGAEVCHFDAAKSANTRARINAELSDCPQNSIRWMTEDALKFMTREVKRGNKYEAIILDPPAFGRMKKKVWKFEKGMPKLLELVKELLSEEPLFLLLTSHNTGWKSSDQLNFVKKNALGLLSGRVSIGDMNIVGDGNTLPLGMYLRVEYDLN